jgi:hypothetical protein
MYLCKTKSISESTYYIKYLCIVKATTKYKFNKIFSGSLEHCFSIQLAISFEILVRKNTNFLKIRSM